MRFNKTKEHKENANRQRNKAVKERKLLSNVKVEKWTEEDERQLCRDLGIEFIEDNTLTRQAINELYKLTGTSKEQLIKENEKFENIYCWYMYR